VTYAAICYDREPQASQKLRASELDAHLSYIATIADRVLIAGPMSIDGSSRFNASLLIYAVDNEQDARSLLESDPYFIAGIYGDVTLAPFTAARGTWLQER
jgi:uncharacterized protein YciI